MKDYQVIVGMGNGETHTEVCKNLDSALGYYHEAQAMGYSATLIEPKKLKREWDWMFIPADGVFEASWNAHHPQKRDHFYNVMKDEEKGTWYISDAFGAAYGEYANPLSAMLAVENSWEEVKVS